MDTEEKVPNLQEETSYVRPAEETAESEAVSETAMASTVPEGTETECSEAEDAENVTPAEETPECSEAEDAENVMSAEETPECSETEEAENITSAEETPECSEAEDAENVTSAEEAPETPEAEVTKEVPTETVSVEETAGKKKMSRVGKTFLIIGIVLTTLLLAAGITGWLYFEKLYKLSNFQDVTSVQETVASEEAGEEETTTGETLDEKEKEALEASIKKAQEEAREAQKKKESEEKATEEQFVLREEGVQNILLIGMDEAGGNSDAIIICSIDYERKRITLTSIMRDTAAYIPNYGVRKINSAAAIAGPPLLVETVEQNFMVDIDNYAMVNFQAMKAVIDALGGVDMFITVQEAEFMKIEIPEDRVIHLTGKMAVRHSRDRSSGGSDYGRTQRQKNVLLAIIDKARSGGLGDLTKAAETVLPYITHDFSRSDLLSIMMNLPELVGFEFRQARIPFDGLYHNEGEFLVVDTAATVQQLKTIIYED